jgi:hypothetical protein
MAIYCTICKKEIGEDKKFSANKKGDLMCTECIALMIELVINMLGTDELAELLKKKKFG